MRFQGRVGCINLLIFFPKAQFSKFIFLISRRFLVVVVRCELKSKRDLKTLRFPPDPKRELFREVEHNVLLLAVSGLTNTVLFSPLSARSCYLMLPFGCNLQFFSLGRTVIQFLNLKIKLNFHIYRYFCFQNISKF